MSTIRVDNFGPAAGGTTYSARGIAKVWINFNGTGTIAARDSENVSSLADNGTGDYNINFSAAFGAADYAATATAGANGTTYGNGRAAFPNNSAPAASAFRLNTKDTSDGTNTDDPLVYFVTFGDLA